MRWRPAGPLDWPRVARLIRRAFPLTFDPFLTDGIISYYCRDLGPAMRVLVDSVDPVGLLGPIVAVTVAVPRPEQRCAWLELIAVDPARAGTGLGHRALDLVEHAAAGAGFPRLELAVLETNARAIAFYERQGYRCMGPQPGDARVEGPRLRYGKSLPPATFRPDPRLGLGAAPPAGRVRDLTRRVLYRALVPRKLAP